MKVLVTGNLGYIGTVLTPKLVSRGHEVKGYDCDFYKNCTFGNYKINHIETLNKDVRDVELKDVKGYDAIIHLAALSNDPLGNINPELTYDINYRSSLRFARLAKIAGVKRFIFSSSCSNYGAGGKDFLNEDSMLNPVTPYGESKVMVEKEVSALSDEDFSPTFLRNATAYGVSPRLRFDLVLNNLVAWAFTTGKIFMKSDGTPWRPVVHVEDICNAFIAILEAPRKVVHDQVFNVGVTGDNVQIKELARVVSEVVPDCRVAFSKQASADKRNYRVNCDRICKIVEGFKPIWNIRKGAQQLFESYRKYGITLEEFEGPRYKRISQIRKLLKEGVLDENLRFQKRYSVSEV